MSATRWATEHGGTNGAYYLSRFRQLAADGVDLAGEARMVDALLPRGARVLDAGCGAGRVGAELAARGHEVIGVDADVQLIEAARTDHPAVTWLVADLAVLDLTQMGEHAPFDAAVLAGNVLPFVAPGTEVDVLRHVAAHVRPGGAVVVGFGTDRGYSTGAFARHCAAAGLLTEHRFATWDLRPWTPAADFLVAVLRTPMVGA